MNATIPLSTALLVLLGAVLAWLVYAAVHACNAAIEKSTGRISDSAAEVATAALVVETSCATLTAAVNQLHTALAPASAELQSNMAAVPKLLEMVAKVGSAQLEIMQAQRAAAGGDRRQEPFRPNAPMAPRDTEAGNLEYDVTRMMRAEGISREESMMRMNGANDSSVWGGDTMFKDWR